ncbi:hypothetical protein Pstr01_29820 [Pseudomonas straminea]|uniref:Virus tail fibre assembly protein, lambda gpK n=1 Tax=Pseudomonas straminea TaxID=47882 RepID=A0A1I1WH74_PSEOC|nr:hypothetical protein [Pseudomonas straminea]GLX14743.1 hypothetical protein Pstr01_29820 [Pseudomonas straminea]SFD92440.1 hypothetical protein SAMN05216372_105380 [Pseudomonas straminea]
MHIYIQDNAGALTGPLDLPETPGIGIQLPSNGIQLASKLAKPMAGKTWALVDGRPAQIADFRGQVYSTETGAPQHHDSLGPLPESLTAQPRPSLDHKWKGTTWVIDAELQAANRQALLTKLCKSIDTDADAARAAVIGSPMRAVEYDRARLEAEQFRAAGYEGEAPPMVAAWVTSERNAQAAAEDILREAAQYEHALVQVRTIRLQAKEQIRALMAAGDVDQAAQLTEQTIADLAACVQGVGNA